MPDPAFPMPSSLMKVRFPMTCLRRLSLGLIFGGLLVSLLLPVAAAQQIHSLDIRDGAVYVDDRPLSEDQLPNDLNLEGIDAHYRFLGIERPVIELNNRLFAVDDGLRPVTEEEVRENNASVILRDGTVRSASSAARAASSAPEDLRREYLDELQQSSRQLYDRLVQEQQMEQETKALARTIRLMPDGEARRAKIDTLRSTLNDIFDLKQENRRREIERLQQKIQELQRSIQKREEMRERMIERRLQQLLRSGGG